MLYLSRNDEVDTESYGDALNRLGYVYYDRKEADASLAFLNCQASTMANRAKFVMMLKSRCKYCFLSKDAVYSYLVNFEGCPERYFYTRNSESVSLDMKKVLSKLVKNGKAIEFLDYYMRHRSLTTKHSKLKTILAAGYAGGVAGKDHYGNDLMKVHFSASEVVNRRFNYKDFDIISQIPRDMTSIISAEDGYFLAWGDFAQSDFRIAYNLFMRSEENDRIMSGYADKYEALARIVYKSLGKEFVLEEFKKQRRLFKELILATVYGMRTSVVPEEAEFISMFAQFLEKCPKYKEYYQRLRKQTILNAPICVNSYFGNEQFVFPQGKGENTILYEALNMPVQTGTSEIVIMTVNSILKAARKCGLSEDQFSLYLTRHDEPIFRIREDAIPFLWILRDHSKIFVDDWFELSLDFEFGYHYKIPDDELTSKAQKVFEGKEEQSFGEKSVLDSIDYFPVKSPLLLAFHAVPVEESECTIVAIQDTSTGQAMFSIFETLDTAEVIQGVREKICAAEEKIRTLYSGVLVRSNFYEGQDFFGDTRVIYRKEINAGMNQVVFLCRGMTALYCRKHGIAAPDGCNEPLQEYPSKLDVLIVE